jgi:hypothetical protein
MANSTPPIGDPKATATPAALDAVTISLILAFHISLNNESRDRGHTVTLVIPPKLPRDDIPKTTSDVY